MWNRSQIVYSLISICMWIINKADMKTKLSTQQNIGFLLNDDRNHFSDIGYSKKDNLYSCIKRFRYGTWGGANIFYNVTELTTRISPFIPVT